MHVADTRLLVTKLLNGSLDCLQTGCSVETDAAVTVQPASRAALENLATAKYLLPLFTTCFCSYFYPGSVAQCSTNYQCLLVKIINAILQIEKSTAESATETFRPSDLSPAFPRIVLNLKNASRAVQDTNRSSGAKMIPLL